MSKKHQYADELDRRVLCKCPKCDTIYTRVIPWTGRGMPRIRCRDCVHHFSHVLPIDDLPTHGPVDLSRWERLGWV